jgi:pyruvate/2-oxoglutarate/acetoin dehydrogenase E1 component
MHKERLITYREAINEALVQEMERDKNVFVYGLDVADHKRIFGSTVGLVEKFGGNRCFSTPLCEDALAGFGLGAAMNGLRPVFVNIRVDFLLLAMNQIVNMISNYHYITGGKLTVPITIRAVIGRGWGQGAQHSKTMQSVFAHIPGLKVVMPSRASDVKGLLTSAIRDNNPVIVLEHRWLYDISGPVAEEAFEMPIGIGNILKEGSDITVVSTSWMNVEALRAAEVLDKRGIDVEVIDPISISPLDTKIITDSVNKTGHCVVADLDWVQCGFGSEIAAVVGEKCFGKLKSSITRIGFEATPCPTVRILENKFYPNAINIIRAVEDKLGLSKTDLSEEIFYSYENKFKGPF